MNNVEAMNGIGMLIACSLAGGVVYFIPSMVAVCNSRKNALAIFALNLLLGFTLVGWVAALVWSLVED